MNIPDHISESKKCLGLKIFKFLDFFDANPDPGSGIFLTLDPGSGMGKNRLRDKHSGSATLFLTATPEARYLNYGSGSSSYLNIFRLLDFYYQILIKLEEFL
jgi:hypothetical protein